MKKMVLFLALAFCYLTSFSQETSTFTDPRDGRIYKTVKIGTQTWFAENLDYITSDRYRFMYDKYRSKYGNLYIQEEALKVCPKGWHLPSDEEWSTLINYLGGNRIAGYKMKSTDESWEETETAAGTRPTNESGFDALPGGRNESGLFSGFNHIGIEANFWSSSMNKMISNYLNKVSLTRGIVKGGRIILSSDRVSIIAGVYYHHLSIRCVKDK